MQLGLKNKVVVITGGSRGIGRAIAECFLAEGARVVIAARREENLADFLNAHRSSRARILTLQGDMTREADIAALVAAAVRRFKRIDCLVPNIGKGAVRFGHNLDESDWNETFAINFWGAVRLVSRALPLMKRGGGSIVCVAALAGQEAVGAPLSYSTAKAALIAYAKNLSREVAEFNIRVNCVAPGNIFFKGGRWEEKLQENKEKFTKYIEEAVPMKRFGKPEEIAGLVAFLSSERASFITGECVTADGGQRRGL